jgi:hypothetical protein
MKHLISRFMDVEKAKVIIPFMFYIVASVIFSIYLVIFINAAIQLVK